jgi:hypothetical protein
MWDEENGCVPPGRNGDARHRGTPLTVAEIRALKEGAEVVVTWSGGNGPWRYRISVENGLPCILTSDGQGIAAWLLPFGTEQELPLNRVTL